MSARPRFLGPSSAPRIPAVGRVRIPTHTPWYQVPAWRWCAIALVAIVGTVVVSLWKQLLLVLA
jgi:hypothetical protein